MFREFKEQEGVWQCEEELRETSPQERLLMCWSKLTKTAIQGLQKLIDPYLLWLSTNIFHY